VQTEAELTERVLPGLVEACITAVLRDLTREAAEQAWEQDLQLRGQRLYAALETEVLHSLVGALVREGCVERAYKLEAASLHRQLLNSTVTAEIQDTAEEALTTHLQSALLGVVLLDTLQEVVAEAWDEATPKDTFLLLAPTVRHDRLKPYNESLGLTAVRRRPLNTEDPHTAAAALSSRLLASGTAALIAATAASPPSAI
jgi:hypothetical protein